MHNYKKDSTSHILTSSANLIGACLIIITGLKVSGLESSTVLDKAAASSSVLFLISGTFAYLSMRGNVLATVRRRDVADYSFLGGLFLLVVTVVLISFKVIV